MKTSAGLLPFRRGERGVEVLIAHPGGPLWSRKEAGAWSVIKGEVDQGEEPVAAALREFTEETGWPAPSGELTPIGTAIQRSGKQVVAFAVDADFDPESLEPGMFRMAWRGRIREFPEIDQVRWCSPAEAKRLLNPAQVAFVDRLLAILAAAGDP